MEIIRAIRWSDDGQGITIVDQRRLPERFVERDLRTLDEVCDAIRTLAVRGAPAIGIAGAMGLVVVLAGERHDSIGSLRDRAIEAGRAFRDTRPTAVNLPWAIDRMLARVETMVSSGEKVDVAIAALRDEADAILAEDRAMCRAIGERGVELVPNGARVLTHCNAGALATGGIGTALAPLYVAAERGLDLVVFADETRPLLQGSRLTAWELNRAGIPVTVLADGAAASLMRDGSVDLVVVGADRIAANGDVANKIGTYALAIAARHHGIPFYVAAPSSTFDPETPTGADIHVEQRGPEEVRRGFGTVTAPDDVAIFNPAFDITPAALVTAIISDQGVHRPPYDFSHAPRSRDR